MSEWSKRIADLESAGWSIKRISDEIGLAYSSVSDLKSGLTREPRGMAAVRLHQLHLRLCPPSASASPSAEQAA